MYASGLNAVYPSAGATGSGYFTKLARLVTPIPFPPFEFKAVYQYWNGEVFTQGLMILGEGDYAEIGLQIPTPVIPTFPYGFEVVPDRPAVPWV